MNKTEIIARRLFGWKLNHWDRWYDYEKGLFIKVSEFQPEQRLDDAMKIVDKLEDIGYTYTLKEDNKVCFNDICATGNTLAQAITNAAHFILLAENRSIADELV